MVKTSDLKEWLRARHDDLQFFQGPDIPDYPDAMCILTPTAGGGLSAEQVIDQPAWQLRVAGPQGDPNVTAAVAEDLIYAIEADIVINLPNQVLGGRRVIAAQRLGSQPTNLPSDSAGRVHFTVTVMLTTQSGY